MNEQIPLLATSDDDDLPLFDPENNGSRARFYQKPQENYTQDEQPSLSSCHMESETNLKAPVTIQQDGRQKQPELPNGKEYHLFISFSSKDEEQVLPLVKSLEERFGIKCMYADRDFHSGKNILENITDNLKKSMKALIILSNNYNDSGPCNFEIEQALYRFYLSEGRKQCLIPLMLFPCKIPEMLQTMTYIDASKETDLTQKVMDAFYYEELAYSDAVENGTTVCTVQALQSYGNSCCIGSSWVFPPLSEDQKSVLRSSGIEEAIDIYKTLREEINSSFFMRFRSMVTLGWQCVMVSVYSCCLAFVLALIVMSAIQLMSKYLMLGIMVGIVSLVAGVGACCCWQLLRCCFASKMEESMSIFMANFYEKHIQDKGYFIYCVPDSCEKLVVSLYIVLYDTTPCKTYLVDKFRRRGYTGSDQVIQDIVQMQMCDLIKGFVRFPSRISRLQTGVNSRHRTHKQRLCACQQLENLMNS